MPATQRFTHLADFSTRHDFLDWLRVIAILVLLFVTVWSEHIDSAVYAASRASRSG
jgi:hypothetical protein